MEVKGLKTFPATTVNVKDIPRFYYAGNGKGGALNDPFYPGYNVTVTKDLLPPTESGCQDIVIGVTTPPIPCNKYVVFSLDNSGSTLQSDISDPMMTAIENALDKNKDVSYARVDWHGVTDFDYSSGRFYPVSHWSKEPSLIANEEYGTAYAGGLQEAVRLLKVEQAKMSSFDKKTTAWMIVFVTGMSEYSSSQLAPIVSDANRQILAFTPSV